MCTLLSVVLRPLGEDQTILARNLRIHAAAVGRRSTIGWFIYKRTPSRARIRPENTLQYRTDPPRDEFVVDRSREYPTVPDRSATGRIRGGPGAPRRSSRRKPPATAYRRSRGRSPGRSSLRRRWRRR